MIKNLSNGLIKIKGVGKSIAIEIEKSLKASNNYG